MPYASAGMPRRTAPSTAPRLPFRPETLELLSMCFLPDSEQQAEDAGVHADERHAEDGARNRRTLFQAFGLAGVAQEVRGQDAPGEDTRQEESDMAPQRQQALGDLTMGPLS